MLERKGGARGERRRELGRKYNRLHFSTKSSPTTTLTSHPMRKIPLPPVVGGRGIFLMSSHEYANRKML